MLAVIPARMDSTRLPGKVLADLGGRKVLSWIIEAAHHSGVFDDVVVATSTSRTDDPIVNFTACTGVKCVRGSSGDVLARFLTVLDELGDGPVTRLTGDCPLLDPAVIRRTVLTFQAAPCSYTSTVDPRSLPRGLDVEVVSSEALRDVAKSATDVDRIHVTSAVRRNPSQYPAVSVVFKPPAEDLRVTLDEPADLSLLSAVIEHLGFSASNWQDLVNFLRNNADIRDLNTSVRQKHIEEG
jgi:spore coat polysaccharide biosynthesis protein SpsF